MTLVAEPARPSAVSGAAADGCIVMEVLEVPKLAARSPVAAQPRTGP